MDRGILSGHLSHSIKLNGQMWKVRRVSEVKHDSVTASFQAWKALSGYQSVKGHTCQRLGGE